MYKPAPDYDTKAKLHLGVSGKIVQWNEEKGYGFVQTQALAEPIFFHASTLTAREHAPKKGEVITIKAQYDANKKRWQATEVTSPMREQHAAAQQKRDNALIRPLKDKLIWAIPIALIYLVVLYTQAPKLALSNLFISLVAVVLYAWDKRCALSQSSRIPETSLHALALIGGWAGALIARYLFRHKTQKQPFVSLFWFTVLLNIAATVYFIYTGSLNNLLA
ncbi:DUF1294 domain-containing protein [Neisseriaceae bacterium B1]